MEKFICDRRVKWRTACNSDTSGSAGGVERRRCTGISADPATGGGNCVPAPRPGLLNSNINGSRDCSSGMVDPLERIALKPGVFTRKTPVYLLVGLCYVSAERASKDARFPSQHISRFSNGSG